MTKTERKKLDCVLRYIAAEDDATRKRAVEEAREMLRSGEMKTPTTKVSEVIEDLLTEIGVTNVNKGYAYLLYAIYYVFENPDSVCCGISTEVYPYVARTLGADRSAVERCIRHSITFAFDRGDVDFLHQLFGNTVSVHTGVPTNRQFFAICAREVARRCREAGVTG